MKLSESLIKILSRTYEPSAMINTSFKGNDIAFRTDGEGNPVLLFFGRLTEKGTIKGERYARTLKKDRSGAVIKDHWERKGSAT